MLRSLFLITAFLFVSPHILTAQTLKVALAQIDISPKLGSPMAGYSARQGTSTGGHDPLLAQLVLFEQGETSVALLTFDLRRFVSPTIVAGVKALGVDHVLLASSHTHSGPNSDDDKFAGVAGPWRSETESRVIAMVKQALSEGFEARIAAGEGSVYLGHNRIRVETLPDGTQTSSMFWRNEEKTPTYPVDPMVGVLRIEDTTGKLRAVLVNYACHAVVLGPDNLEVSADYPGAMRAALERSLGDGVQVSFLQGAAGDINPYFDKQPIEQRAFEVMTETGEALAAAALPVIERLTKNDETGQPQLKARSAQLDFENRWQAEGEQERVVIDLVSLALDDSTAMVFVPGELFVEHQITLAARSPYARTFFVGYATSSAAPWPGYIPTFEAATRFGYGASYNTHIEEGAGEVIIDRAVIDLYRLKGRLESPEGGAVRTYP